MTVRTRTALSPKTLAFRLLRRLAETPLGWKLIEAVIAEAPDDPRGSNFTTARKWPSVLRGFDDLMFLFTPTSLNNGTISQRIDEAAHLYRTAAELPPSASLVEIGRFKGGSTFLLAAAMPADAELHSYDLHVELPSAVTGESIDGLLREALIRYDLDGRVHLHIADSRAAEALPCDLLFIDGDHSYGGARADFERWFPGLKLGGHLLLHDAAPPVGYPRRLQQRPGVQRLTNELRERADLSVAGVANSIVHFIRTS